MSKAMKEIFTAKSIEEAKKMAEEKFGVSQDYIVYRILEEPKKSIFGKIKREAQVEAVYEPPVEQEKEPAEEASVTEQSAKPEVIPAPSGAETAPEQTEEQIVSPEHSGGIGIESEEVECILSVDELSPGLARARQYVIDIYEKMGVAIEIEVMKTKSGIRMELKSDSKSGTIIGRRGETLDSVQYLASIIANKNSDTYCRMMLDSHGYREKRRRTLEQLADKIARNVQRSGRSTTLEPMNPYERRIIHSRIAEIDGVSSRSVGEDPYRKVVISSVGGPRRGGNGTYRGGRKNGGKRPYRERKPEDFKRRDLDSMKTSFERDYKKPKPEDELNAGLYGKIEF